MPTGGELGIKTGEYWAYRQGVTHPLQRALILNPGQHSAADVRIRLVDDHAVTELWSTRQKLVCKWSSVEIYLLDHPDVPQTYGPTPAPTPPPEGTALAFNANELRAIIHDEIVKALGVAKVAYTYQEAAIATGLSTTALRIAVRGYRLVPHYWGKKALFSAEELRRFVAALPEDPWFVR